MEVISYDLEDDGHQKKHKSYKDSNAALPESLQRVFAKSTSASKPHKESSSIFTKLNNANSLNLKADSSTV